MALVPSASSPSVNPMAYPLICLFLTFVGDFDLPVYYRAERCFGSYGFNDVPVAVVFQPCFGVSSSSIILVALVPPILGSSV